jgi:hypothetical protein
MKTLLKILTFPIWFPIKVLWVISKVLAFIFLFCVLALLLYLFLHFS